MNKKLNLNIYKKSQNISNLEKTPHEIVKFLMESLLTAMKNIKMCTDKNFDNTQSNNSDLLYSKNDLQNFNQKI